jgi:hypothetical protein
MLCLLTQIAVDPGGTLAMVDILVIVDIQVMADIPVTEAMVEAMLG